MDEAIVDCSNTMNLMHEKLRYFISRLFDEASSALDESMKFYALVNKEDMNWYVTTASRHLEHVITSPIYGWVVTVFRLCFIPIVAYGMEDRPEQIFLLVYSFIMLKRHDVASSDDDTMRLWRLLLPSLLLARQALPSLPEGEFVTGNGRRPWRILSLTLHIIVIFMEIREATSDSTDPAMESVVVGFACVYVFSLNVFTGISVLGLLSAAFLFNLYLCSLSKFEPQFMYAIAFYLENVFLKFNEVGDKDGGRKSLRRRRGD